MKSSSRLLAMLTAALAVLAFPSTATAATIVKPFAADSGDSCRYGRTSGTLGWRTGATSPLPFIAVDVRGEVSDRPLPNDPSTACHDDGYYSVANFTAYAGSVAVDRQTRTADNASVSFQFTLGGTSTTTVIDRIVVQVCRHPLVTLPPSYCGKAVTYLAPPTA